MDIEQSLIYFKLEKSEKQNKQQTVHTAPRSVYSMTDWTVFASFPYDSVLAAVFVIYQDLCHKHSRWRTQPGADINNDSSVHNTVPDEKYKRHCRSWPGTQIAYGDNHECDPWSNIYMYLQADKDERHVRSLSRARKSLVIIYKQSPDVLRFKQTLSLCWKKSYTTI